jgi:hypothetical protein
MKSQRERGYIQRVNATLRNARKASYKALTILGARVRMILRTNPFLRPAPPLLPRRKRIDWT